MHTAITAIIFQYIRNITDDNNTTQFYNIDNGNDNMNASFGQRKPTISQRLDHIHISLDQVKNHMKSHPLGQTTNDDVVILKSRIDDIELMLEKQIN